MNELRKTFVAGLLVAVPMALTLFIFIWLFHFFDGMLAGPVTHLLRNLRVHPFTEPIPGVGLLVLIVLILLVGTLTRNYFGKKLFLIGDFIVTRIPIINRIYIAIREISEAVLSEKREIFKKAVLIEYPRKGLYSIAFFTQDTRGPVQDRLDDDVVSVFVPTTPNPTSGFLLFVPKRHVTELEMTVEDALKLVISGGSLHLKEKKGIDILSEKHRQKNRKKKTGLRRPVADQAS
ncbi:MAG TPA: DUF502 domain-containing protein [bacterium]|nr:DUF502 domain-containing protein [bacterium]